MEHMDFPVHRMGRGFVRVFRARGRMAREVSDRADGWRAIDEIHRME